MLVVRLVALLHAEAGGLVAGDSPRGGLRGLLLRLHAQAGRDVDAMARSHLAWPELMDLVSSQRAGEGGLLDGVVVDDGAVWRALSALMIDAHGAPLSYRDLDIEQLGGVYEALMNDRLLCARGPSLALRPDHVVVDLAQLLAQEPTQRAAWLADEAGCALDLPAQSALAAADCLEKLVAALARKRSPRAPDVIPAGCYYLQPGEERRRAGAHYTPRELARPVVRTALRPLLAALGERPTPAQLLGLKICDPAMGSGAFLLETCRQLAEQLELAWRHHGGAPPDVDRGAHARDLVARHCLYGVDKDPCAVELARLSLWLLARPGGSPREYLAHALRCGDALVGLDPTRIAGFHWDPDAAGDPSREAQLRGLLAPAARGDARPPATATIRRIADALVAVFHSHDGDRQRDEHRARLARDGALLAWRGEPGATAALERLAAALGDLDPPVIPFHWELEFPEVFTRDDPGFDGFVGNPPFFWGNRISRVFGGRYRDWLLRCYPGSHGNADLAAYFLRRAFGLLRRGGTLGFVTTNSIAEADTRATGLDHLLRAGGVVYEAVRSAEWGGSASVRVAHVFVARGGDPGPRRLDGRPVAEIGADLRPPQSTWTAVRLRERAGQSYKGVDFGGTGFLLTADQRERIVRAAPHEAACIWPVMNASNFTSSAQLRPSGFIINFTGRTLAESEQFPQCMAIVRERVLPRRAVDKRKARRERWWLYNEGCSGLYRAIAGKTSALACAVVAKYVAFAFVDARAVFTNALNVFTLDSHAALAVLQSRVHELWALTHSSSLRADPRYNPSDCFETFPFPRAWRHSEALERAGRDYDECRRRVMLRRAHGLTATYNRFHDPDERSPDIGELRGLHAAMDRAVLAAYGWTDLAARADAAFHGREDPDRPDDEVQIVRPAVRLGWSRGFADEVLARLFALNRERAQEEQHAEAASTPTIRRVVRRRPEARTAG